jgi:hypothetical protein
MAKGSKNSKTHLQTRIHELGAHGEAYKIIKLHKFVDFFSPAQLLPSPEYL